MNIWLQGWLIFSTIITLGVFGLGIWFVIIVIQIDIAENHYKRGEWEKWEKSLR